MPARSGGDGKFHANLRQPFQPAMTPMPMNASSVQPGIESPNNDQSTSPG